MRISTVAVSAFVTGAVEAALERSASAKRLRKRGSSSGRYALMSSGSDAAHMRSECVKECIRQSSSRGRGSSSGMYARMLSRSDAAKRKQELRLKVVLEICRLTRKARWQFRQVRLDAVLQRRCTDEMIL